jgi:hypothetical protein
MSYVFVDTQAPGAWPNKATVRKVNSQPDDGTPDGTLGVIVGSIDVRELGKPAAFAYFVCWANRPGIPPIFCADTNRDGTPRLELVDDATA